MYIRNILTWVPILLIVLDFFLITITYEQKSLLGAIVFIFNGKIYKE